MATLRDLVPFPTAKEMARAMKKLGDAHDLSRAEFGQKLHDLIVVERSERAAIVARMMQS